MRWPSTSMLVLSGIACSLNDWAIRCAAPIWLIDGRRARLSSLPGTACKFYRAVRASVHRLNRSVHRLNNGAELSCEAGDACMRVRCVSLLTDRIVFVAESLMVDT